MRRNDALTLRELKAIFADRVGDSFEQARHRLERARGARRNGDRVALRKWLWCVRVLPTAAAGWRDRGRCIVPVLLCAFCYLGCAKVPPPAREFSANFEVQPSSDGSTVIWSLQFKTREQYHQFIETTADGTERATVRELIAAGLQLHHLVGCPAQEKAITKLGPDGIAFVGSCPVGAHAVPAGGI